VEQAIGKSQPATPPLPIADTKGDQQAPELFIFDHTLIVILIFRATFITEPADQGGDAEFPATAALQSRADHEAPECHRLVFVFLAVVFHLVGVLLLEVMAQQGRQQQPANAAPAQRLAGNQQTDKPLLPTTLVALVLSTGFEIPEYFFDSCHNINSLSFSRMPSGQPLHQ
jgi:hypothetical protein